jgi:hypothetical protein
MADAGAGHLGGAASHVGLHGLQRQPEERGAPVGAGGFEPDIQYRRLTGQRHR